MVAINVLSILIIHYLTHIVCNDVSNDTGLAHSEYRRPPFSSEDTFQDPQRMPEIMDSAEPCMYVFPLHTYL